MTSPSEPSPSGKEEPILILDIKLVKDRPEKIIVYEKDVPEDVVRRFCEEHSKLEFKSVGFWSDLSRI